MRAVLARARSSTRFDADRREQRVTLAEISNQSDDARSAVEPARSVADATQSAATTVIYVCTTCRQPDDPEDQPRQDQSRPGAALAAATARAAENTGIAVHPMRCLANCKRGCSAVMQRAGAFSYVFGHLDPALDADALVEGAKLLSQSPDGLMPWRGRPEALKRGLIARVPPLHFQGTDQ
jgi:predicted metal-binding protein